jgi:hypothetical protein
MVRVKMSLYCMRYDYTEYNHIQYTNVSSPYNLALFLLEPSREIVMGLEGGYYGFGLWKMKILNIP